MVHQVLPSRRLCFTCWPCQSPPPLDWADCHSGCCPSCQTGTGQALPKAEQVHILYILAGQVDLSFLIEGWICLSSSDQKLLWNVPLRDLWPWRKWRELATVASSFGRQTSPSFLGQTPTPSGEHWKVQSHIQLWEIVKCSPTIFYQEAAWGLVCWSSCLSQVVSICSISP